MDLPFTRLDVELRVVMGVHVGAGRRSWSHMGASQIISCFKESL